MLSLLLSWVLAMGGLAVDSLGVGGRPVDIGVEWQAVVESLSPASGAEFAVLPPQNATGNWVKIVQRVPVRIRLSHHDGELPLRAGLSAWVEIDTGHRRTLLGLRWPEPEQALAGHTSP